MAADGLGSSRAASAMNVEDMNTPKRKRECVGLPSVLKEHTLPEHQVDPLRSRATAMLTILQERICKKVELFLHRPLNSRHDGGRSLVKGSENDWVDYVVGNFWDG